MPVIYLASSGNQAAVNQRLANVWCDSPTWRMDRCCLPGKTFPDRAAEHSAMIYSACRWSFKTPIPALIPSWRFRILWLSHVDWKAWADPRIRRYGSVLRIYFPFGKRIGSISAWTFRRTASAPCHRAPRCWIQFSSWWTSLFLRWTFSIQAQILNLIEDLKRNFRMTMMFISNDMTVVEHICDNVAVMYLGALVERAKAVWHSVTSSILISRRWSQQSLSLIYLSRKGSAPSCREIFPPHWKSIRNADLPSAVPTARWFAKISCQSFSNYVACHCC